MSLSDTFELSGHIVVKTGRGIGYHESVDEEVVFIGVAFSDASAAQPASDASAGLVESSDPSKPWCYDKSREKLFQLAKDIRDAGHMDDFGFGLDCPAVKYAIPGIPFDQKDDTGGHLTLYVRPGYAASGARYQPPDLAKALQIKGQPANITFLPPSEGIKILNGAENNDMETGVCYYIALMPDANGKQVANDLKSSVGLEVNLRQDLHLTIAGAAPAWQKVHPKSQAYRDATEEEQKTMNLKEDFQVFRKGVGSFAGFNAEVVTGWNTYAAAIAAISQETAHINYTVAQLEKQKVELDEKIAELNSKKKNPRTELGFAKSIGNSEAKKLKSALPDAAQQTRIMAFFANKCAYGCHQELDPS